MANISFAKPIIDISGSINSNTGYRIQNNHFRQIRLPDAQIIAGNIKNDTGTKNTVTNNPDATSEAKINIHIADDSKSDIKYGLEIDFAANINSTSNNNNIYADKTFIFFESNFGKLEFGNNSAANYVMKIGPATFARGAGGINGKYLEYVNMPMLADASQTLVNKIGNCNGYQVNSAGVINQSGTNCSNIKLPSFILIPQSPIAHGGYAQGFYDFSTNNHYSNYLAEDKFGFNKNKSSSQIRDGNFGNLGDATKISYYTKRILGWKAAISFAPDTNDNGFISPIYSNNNKDIKQVVGYGINYSDQLGDSNIGLGLSFTGEFGKFKRSSLSDIDRNNLKAFDIGVAATYFGFVVGASYGDWGRSLQPKSGIYSCDYNNSITIANQNCAGINNNRLFDNSTYKTFGIEYEYGHLATSITYLSSNFKKNKYNALSFGLDYKVAKNLMPYFEVTKYQFESNQPKAIDIIDQSLILNNSQQLKNNKGYVILTGLLFSF
jgi:hypothetical protein